MNLLFPANRFSCMRSVQHPRRVGLLTLGLLLAAGVLLAVPQKARSDGGSGPVTYDQAVSNGWIQPYNPNTDPMTGQFHVPLCSAPTGDGGYSTPEDLEAAIAQASPNPTCMDDPRSALYVDPTAPTDPSALFGTSRPGPSQGYYYSVIGTTTAGLYQGYRADIEVGDPSVHHDLNYPRDELVDGRVHAPTSCCDLEAGWTEVSDSLANTQYVYSQQVDDGFYMAEELHTYPLVPGKYYSWRVRDFGGNAVVAEFFWQGSWRVLEVNYYYKCANTVPDGQAFCRGEVGTEIYSPKYCRDQGICPTLNAPTDGNGVNYRYVQVRTGPGVWQDWNPSYVPTLDPIVDSPYSFCHIVDYTKFRTPRGSC